MRDNTKFVPVTGKSNYWICIFKSYCVLCNINIKYFFGDVPVITALIYKEVDAQKGMLPGPSTRLHFGT